MIKWCIFFFLLSILIWFLLITWCWIIHLKGATSVAHSPHFGFLRAKPSGWLCTTNSQSQNAPELAPQILTVYSRTQLSMVPLWFSNLHKKTTTTLYFSYNVYYTGFSIQYFILLIHSALGFFFLLLSFLWDNETGRWQNAFFWQTEHRSTNVLLLLEFWGKKIYRMWLLCCKFLSSICP